MQIWLIMQEMPQTGDDSIFADRVAGGRSSKVKVSIRLLVRWRMRSELTVRCYQ